MATTGHAAYCLETLASELEHRPALSFQTVQQLWERFEAEKAGEQLQVTVGSKEQDAENTPASRPQIPEIARLQGRFPISGSSSSSASTSSSNTAAGTPASSNSSVSINQSISSAATESFPLFITWNTVARNGSKSLRGCIGTFDSKELAHGLEEYAFVA